MKFIEVGPQRAARETDMKIGIGIDTGGTYTDVVAFDFTEKKVLSKGKALTTRENLSIGINKALDILPQEYIRDAAIVSLSTTLSTNACIEDKGCRAKLIVFGMTDELLTRFKGEEKYGISRDSVRCVDTNSSADGLIVDEPDWNGFEKEFKEWIADAEILSTSELYSVYNGAPCEKKLKELSRDRFDITCVCANEITSEINVIQRGATALLNARLLPMVQEFIKSIIKDFRARGCASPIMIVRSDGSLMSAAASLDRPVETILSGPAASVLAGKLFSNSDDYVIIDMGGTTTDISVVTGGKAVAAENGIQLGKWRTTVQGLYVASFGLGGDTEIRANEGRLELRTRRVMPMCTAASRWPVIKDKLRALLDRKHYNRFPLHEFFYLVKQPAKRERYSKGELELIDLLAEGPCMMEELPEKAGIDLYHFECERLEAEGIVMRCGLTPTDFMHIKGDYGAFDREASLLAARYLWRSLKREDCDGDMEALTREVYDMVEGRMYEFVVKILLKQRYPKQFGGEFDPQTEFFIREAWRKRKLSPNVLLNFGLDTEAVLIGVGAPTHLFLQEVADALNTECVLPEDAEVANAIGALNAYIDTSVRVEVTQRLSTERGNYYIAHLPTGSRRFTDIDEAIAAAKEAAEEQAVREAKSRGASGKIVTNTYVDRHTAVTRWGTDVSMGCTVVSEASMYLG